MTCDDDSPHGDLLLIEPDDNAQSGSNVQRECHFHIATAQTEVTGLQTHRHVRTVRPEFDLDSYLDAGVLPAIGCQDAWGAAPRVRFDHGSIPLRSDEMSEHLFSN
jgi:hypothetical protein